MTKIITLVGTSLFENFFRRNDKDGSLNSYKCLKERNLSFAEWNSNNTRIKSLEKIGSQQLNSLSAEISSILSIRKQLQEEDEASQIQVHLIATDTILSALAAKLINNWLTENHIKSTFILPDAPFDNQKKHTHVIKDLRISSQDEFQRGMMNLLDVLNKITDKKTILNITGGYKAVVPILTIWAQITKKEVEIKYLFNESEVGEPIEPLTIGEMPISFNWEVVDALKPILKNHILEKLAPLAAYLKKGIIYYSEDKKRYIPKENSRCQIMLNELNAINKNYHIATHTLLSFQLIRIEGDKFTLTPLGKILKEINITDERGYLIEHLFFKFFYLQSNNLFAGYKVCRPFQNLPVGFIVKEGKVTLQKSQNGDTKGFRKLGDCDIPLSKDNTVIWAESKAFSAACGLKEEYYSQLKARALALYSLYSSTKPKVEVLLLVFRFTFKDLNDDHMLASDSFKAVLQKLQKLNSDPDISDFTSFRCVGISIPLEFQKDKINFDPFNKGEFNKWQFEELQVAEGDG